MAGMKSRLRAVDRGGAVRPASADTSSAAAPEAAGGGAAAAANADPADSLQRNLEQALSELSALRDALEASRAKEYALRASTARFRSLTELSADWYWEQDENLRFVSHSGHVQRAVSTRFGPDRGKTRWELPVIGVTEEQWAAHRADLAARRPFRDFEFRRETPDGGIRYISVSGEPIFNASGRFTGYHGVGRDITNRKRAEKMLELEHAVARILAGAHEATPALRAVIRVMCETEGWDCGRGWLLDANVGVLCAGDYWTGGNTAIEAFYEATSDKVIKPGFGLIGAVLQSAQMLWVPDLGADPRAAHLAPAAAIGMRGACLFPLIAEDIIVGVLAFLAKDTHQPDNPLLAAGKVIGSLVGQFLQKKRREAELAESEARYRTLTDLSSDWYWEHDENGIFTRADHFGDVHFRRDDVLGKTRWERGIRCDPRERARIESDIAARRPFRDFEYSRLDRQGIEYYVQTSGAPMFDAKGRYVGYRGVAKDVSERRRRDLDLQRFRAAMDATADAIYLTDRNGSRFIDVNDGACRMLGYTRAELLAMEPSQVFATSHWDDESAERTMEDGGTDVQEIEAVHRRKDGTFVPVEVQRRAKVNGDDWIVVGVARDISARIQSEHSIRINGMRQGLIAKFGQQALAVAEIDELLQHAVATIADGLGVAFSGVFHCSAEGGTTLRAGSGWSDGWVGRRLAPEVQEAATRWMLVTREPVVVEDFARETRFPMPAMLKEHGIASGVEVVVGGAGVPFGIIGAYSRECGAFHAESMNFLQTIANVLGTAVERRNAEQKLSYLAQFDSLTELPNRDLFRDRLAQTLEQAKRNDWTLGILYIDLDGFKVVNDTFGHGAGDKLLALVAQRLKACVRTSDTVGRLGGDEFAIVLSNLAAPADAELVAKALVAALMRPFEVDGNETRMTASVGVSLFPFDGEEADELLKHADTAMYRAKERGRNNYQFYTRELNDRLRRRWTLEQDLSRAIELSEFELHYQPQIAFDTGRVIGVEALIRWHHPERGLLASGEFIGAAEETALIVPIGHWVVDTACMQAAAWHRAGHDDLVVAVNISPVEIQRGNVVEHVESALQRSGLDPRFLEIELTESVVLQGAESSSNVLTRLKELGVSIAIDDFGTGYSSLTYLKHFPIDKVKIDQTFVRDIDNDPDDCAIVQAVIAMSHQLKLKVVAEGVFSQGQARFLRECHCDIAQGYLYGRPMPAAEIAALFRTTASY
jgi:diguanylate cyclase (GGDEF)-like protein/PAS domain S-box-containing protein